MNPAADIWAKVLALMQNEMTTTTINTWFDDTTAVELEGGPLRPLLPHPLQTGYHRQPVSSRHPERPAGAVLRRISGDCAHRGGA